MASQLFLLCPSIDSSICQSLGILGHGTCTHLSQTASWGEEEAGAGWGGGEAGQTNLPAKTGLERLYHSGMAAPHRHIEAG